MNDEFTDSGGTDEPDALPTQEQLDDVLALLADLAFLDPASADASEATSRTPAEPMPDEVWTRLSAAIAAESAGRQSGAGPVVVPLDSARRSSRGRDVSRGARWAGGLVAASVAVVAVGLVVTTLRSDDQTAGVVAGGPPTTFDSELGTSPAPAALLGSAPTGSVAPGSVAPGSAAPDSAARGSAPAAESAANPAARIVLASNTEYKADELPAQVVELVKNAGFTTPEEAMAKVVPTASMPVSDGFTSSWETLRACLTWLTHSANAQALVVDRGTYGGAAAGIVVAPATPAGSASPDPTVTISTGYGVFDVWVVNAECKQIEDALDDFALYAWHP